MKLYREVQTLWNGPTRRMLVFKWLLCAMLLTQMSLCPRLWTSDRAFPTVPAFSLLPGLPQFLTLVLSFSFVFAILAVLIVPAPRAAVWVALVLGVILVLFDITRLQPWFYQAMLGFVGLTQMRWHSPTKMPWAICSVPLVGLYIWSGVSKANLMFGMGVFPWLLHPFGLDALAPAWFLVPIFETAMGILLVAPKTRTLGLVGIAVMHGILLLVLGPLGMNFNSVVWPWNTGMPLIAFTLFFANSDPLFPTVWASVTGKAVAVTVGILPGLHQFGLWDEYLSASLYAGTTRQGFVIISESAAERLPAKFRPFVQHRDDRTGFDLSVWSIAELNVPVYPEARVFRAVARHLLKTGIAPNDLKLVVTKAATFTTRDAVYQVQPIH